MTHPAKAVAVIHSDEELIEIIAEEIANLPEVSAGFMAGRILMALYRAGLTPVPLDELHPSNPTFAAILDRAMAALGEEE